MRSIALFALLCCVVTGCRGPCPFPCHWPCNNDSQPAPQTQPAQIGPPATPREQVALPQPQRIVIEVVQKAAPDAVCATPPQPAARQAISPAPAPAALGPLPGGIAAVPLPPGQPACLGSAVAASPRFMFAPDGVTYQGQPMPGAIASRGLFLDVGAIFDWLLSPFSWFRVVSATQPVAQAAPMMLQQMPQYVQAAYPQAQPMPMWPQAFPGYVCPPCPPCPACASTMPPAAAGLRAADLDALTRQIQELRSAAGN